MPGLYATRVFLILGAVACFLLATALLLITGLPDRADYTGFMLASGQRVAPELNNLAPPFELAALSGGTISLDDFRGSPVIVNFWATWCAPCVVEMPELQALYNAYQDDGLRILALNLDEAPSMVRAWVEEMRLTYDILLDDDEITAQTYRIFAQPSTYVINPDGVIVRIFYGPATTRQLESVILPYLG